MAPKGASHCAARRENAGKYFPDKKNTAWEPGGALRRRLRSARAGALAGARTDSSDFLRARNLAMLLRRRTGNEDGRMSGC
ncbi:MAG: hypothetical protein CRU78_13635 [Candidatus Accumulibacter phosphatis]|uniref:Uncharacterized protein n=1 Tax=Candidatus Accumulibacter phosphatis TaxID=327160 RepID=A0A6A7RVT2_9PROT|nr:hypothetical protein [Candidatus Accumulibacter phosphatis]